MRCPEINTTMNMECAEVVPMHKLNITLQDLQECNVDTKTGDCHLVLLDGRNLIVPKSVVTKEFLKWIGK